MLLELQSSRAQTSGACAARVLKPADSCYIGAEAGRIPCDINPGAWVSTRCSDGSLSHFCMTACHFGRFLLLYALQFCASRGSWVMVVAAWSPGKWRATVCILRTSASGVSATGSAMTSVSLVWVYNEGRDADRRNLPEGTPSCKHVRDAMPPRRELLGLVFRRDEMVPVLDTVPERCSEARNCASPGHWCVVLPAVTDIGTRGWAGVN